MDRRADWKRKLATGFPVAFFLFVDIDVGESNQKPGFPHHSRVSERWCEMAVGSKIKRSEGQAAGFGPGFHLPGQHILEFRFFEPHPNGFPRKATGENTNMFISESGGITQYNIFA